MLAEVPWLTALSPTPLPPRGRGGNPFSGCPLPIPLPLRGRGGIGENLFI